MNTAKIVTLYPYFVDCLRHFDQHLQAGQSLEGLLEKKLQSDGLPAARRYSIALTDLDNPGQHAN